MNKLFAIFVLCSILHCVPAGYTSAFLFRFSASASVYSMSSTSSLPESSSEQSRSGRELLNSVERGGDDDAGAVFSHCSESD